MPPIPTDVNRSGNNDQPPTNWAFHPEPIDDDDNEDVTEVDELTDTPQPTVKDFSVRRIESTRAAYHAWREGDLPIPWLADGELLQLDSFHQLEIVDGVTEVPSMYAPAKRLREEREDYHAQTVKARRTALDASVAEENEKIGQARVELGLYGATNYCSCGNAYTRAFRLRDHVKAQSGKHSLNCSTCVMSFMRADSLRRHKETKHGYGKVECPACHQSFRVDYLRTYFACTNNEICTVIAEAIYLPSNNLPTSSIRPAIDKYWISSIVRYSREAAKGSLSQFQTTDLGPSSDTLAKNLLSELPAQTRPVPRWMREHCDICGVPLGPGEKELVDHIGAHSFNFSTKPFKCDDYQINFANQKDLDMHLEAAAKGHRGFKF